ncbi:hypothetical protein MJI37_34215, partial [Salmonella enterica subsp. enterica serovar Cerro]|nr:hypothetical protein [Salmonella enterica subsp. enterica serovar Cerro]
PTFTDKPGIRITEGRHPVVEQVLNEPFIANPLNLSPQRRMLIYPSRRKLWDCKKHWRSAP